jgi:hypothetical protein
MNAAFGLRADFFLAAFFGAAFFATFFATFLVAFFGADFFAAFFAFFAFFAVAISSSPERFASRFRHSDSVLRVASKSALVARFGW